MTTQNTQHTTTVYYWPHEPINSILTDIHEHETSGWCVHQIAPITFTVGGISDSGLFVVYTKDNA